MDLRVDTTSLDSAGQQLSTLSANFETVAGQIESSLRSCMNAVAEGDTEAAVQTYFVAAQEVHSILTTSLAGLGQEASRAGTTVAEADQALATPVT